MGKRSKKLRAQKKELQRALRKASQQAKDNSPSRPMAFMFITSVFLFIAENFWGSLLANLSFRWGYALFLASNSAILGWWTWLLVGMIYKKVAFAKRMKFTSALTIVFIFVSISSHFVGFFVKPQSTIQIPSYTPDSTQVVVSYGNRHDSLGFQNGDAITTIGELKKKPFVSFAINGQSIFSIHITDQREIAIDTKLFTGFYDEAKHIFKQPIIVTDNAPDYLPKGWNLYRNSDSIEIANQMESLCY